ncbi:MULTISPECIES: helix-turn-helix domain-containing protein [unclassified Bradyrhizobium]|uniref:TetR/AcrR family transcriptional regulator n=1 Tax=unclassified Bradyrhizobium TaxID=2631580 RepID=UPI0020114511|nr:MULTISPECIES: helix-turn-helix domain-containing protein [unclassified Bradyrhizobium]
MPLTPARPAAPGQAMKERILAAADRLFYLQGIRAIGVDTVAAEVGISKRTLYNHFPSKDALVAAYLSRRSVPVPPSDKSPLDQLLGAFDRLARASGRADYRGCPFVNAVAELGNEDHTARRIALDFKESRRLWVRGLLIQLGAADADALATQIVVLIDGAITTDLVRRDPAMAQAAKAAAQVLLRNAGVRVDAPAAMARQVARAAATPRKAARLGRASRGHAS